jgi:hypothetical protein
VRDGQLMDGARVTVVVRCVPGLSVRCGTQVARPPRPSGPVRADAVRHSRSLASQEPQRSGRARQDRSKRGTTPSSPCVLFPICRGSTGSETRD